MPNELTPAEQAVHNALFASAESPATHGVARTVVAAVRPIILREEATRTEEWTLIHQDSRRERRTRYVHDDRTRAILIGQADKLEANGGRG